MKMGICTSTDDTIAPREIDIHAENEIVSKESKKTLYNVDIDSAEGPVLTGKTEARIIDAYDGDTMTILFFNKHKEAQRRKIRLYGVDCPEYKGITSAAGKKAKDEMLKFICANGAIGLPNGKKIKKFFYDNAIVVDVEFVDEVEKFGRQLAKIFVHGESLAEHLIETGNGYRYEGGTKNQHAYENS
jgi:endonuclease YncB( thermonuclease family)